MGLHGRADEERELRAVIEAAARGTSGVRVVRGEPGIGKTALLDDAATAAARLGFEVLAVTGAESEHEFGYAALHRLLRARLDARTTLPAPQRDALGVAFGLVEGRPADPFRVALAVLTLLTRDTARRPLLVVCDDAHWFDQESLRVLAFIARRLEADPVALLFGARDETGDGPGPPALTDLPVVRLGGLATEAVRALATETARGRIDDRELERIVVESGGNPLAVRELAADQGHGPLPGTGVPLAERLPLGTRLEARFAERVRALPEPVQTLLLVVAAEPTGDAGLVWRALVAVGGTAGAPDLATAAAPAVAADLLVLHPAVSFRHPLQRSAVYHGADPALRRRVHAAIAGSVPAGTDADRRVWHLAAAATGPDEEIATELEKAALRARERAGFSAEAAFLAAAAERTAATVPRALRLFTAGIAAIRAGLPGRSHELLELAPAEVPDDLRLAIAMTRGAALIQLGRTDDGNALMTAAGRALAPLRPPAEGRQVLLELLQNALVTPYVDVAVLRELVAEPPADADPPPEPGFTDVALDGHREHLLAGGARGVTGLRRVVAAVETGLTHEVALRWGPVAVATPRELFDDRAMDAVTARLIELARDNAAATGMQAALVARGITDTLLGRFDDAELMHAEAAQVAAIVGAPLLRRRHDALLRAWQDDAVQVADAATGLPTREGVTGGAQLQLVRTAQAVLALSGGRYADAVDVAAPVLAEDPPYWAHLVLPDLVEAAERGGDRPAAEAALARFAIRAEATGTPWALGLLARSRALLDRGGGAEALYREALDHLSRTAVRTELARTHLLHGEWLRRRRRRTDARRELETAHRLFLAMGAPGFAERARTELAAAGASVRRAAGAPRALTAHEARVARLAAGGATNQQIAAQLYVSASTVEYHLRKVFQKTGVRSRRDLAGVDLGGS